jgi:hypothetical protein
MTAEALLIGKLFAGGMAFRAIFNPFQMRVRFAKVSG